MNQGKDSKWCTKNYIEIHLLPMWQNVDKKQSHVWQVIDRIEYTQNCGHENVKADFILQTQWELNKSNLPY